MKFPPKDVRWLQRHLRCVVLEPTSTCHGNKKNTCHQYMSIDFVQGFSSPCRVMWLVILFSKNFFEIMILLKLTLQPSDVHFSSSSDQYKQLDWVIVNV